MGCSLLPSCGLFFEPQVEPATDAFCEWLEEAVQSEPKTRGNGKELTFTSKILGNDGMGNVLIVRKCYVQMKEEAMSWLCAQPETGRIGLFVVTGTPGIGKTLFLCHAEPELSYRCPAWGHVVVATGWWENDGSLQSKARGASSKIRRFVVSRPSWRRLRCGHTTTYGRMHTGFHFTVQEEL